ncbi:MAG TPA: NusG domain II-containing protein [Chitinispirillaceae bacterium]|nr:NusG domain II-containing protein [Chitinispirillaceae bacterium]
MVLTFFDLNKRSVIAVTVIYYIKRSWISLVWHSIHHIGLQTIPYMNNQNNRFITAEKLTVFRWGDALLLTGLIVATVFSFRFFEGSGRSTVLVYRDTTIIAQYPLSDEKIVTVQGKLGDVEIRIKNGAVKIVKSSCDHQICVRTGAITNSYGQIVCVPNHILVCIRSRESKRIEFDAIAR